MSLARLALRFITVKALENRTMVEDRVRDSSIVSLEDALRDEPKPVALVFTDDSSFKPDGRELWGENGTIQLVIVLSVAGVVVIPAREPTEDDPGDPGHTEFRLPHTDRSLELSLDLIERQCQHELMNPDNPWAVLWREIVFKVIKWASVRGGSAKEGARFAARQIVIDCETILEPIPGAPAEGFWADFLAALETDATDADFAPLLRAFIEGKPMPKWKRDAMEYGSNQRYMNAIGLGPINIDPDTAGAIAEIKIVGGGMVTSSEDE